MIGKSTNILTRAGSSLPYIAGITLGFTGYEALKEAFLPGLTKWESHAFSIFVVAILSSVFVTWFRQLFQAQLVRSKQLAEELSQSEERFRALADAALEAIVIIERGRILEVNRAYAEMFGCEQSEMVGKSALGVVAPESVDVVQRNISSGFEETYEAVGLRSNGARFDMEIRGRVSTYRDRAVRVTAIRDITERKQAERELHESELFARGTLDGLSALIVIVDEAGAIITVNKAWREYAESSLAGNVLEGADYLQVAESATGASSEEAAPFAAGIRSVLSGQCEEFELEYPCHSPTERRWFVGRVTRFPAGGPPRAVIAHEDITERKLAEEATRQSEERFRSLVQNASDIITVLEADGAIRYESPSVKKALGYLPEELIGKNAFDYVHPDDAAQVLKSFTKVSDDPQIDSVTEFRFRHADGSWRYLEAIGNNLLDDPSVKGIVVNSRDITEIVERKAIEEQLAHRASHDPLTNLPNRALFMDRLERALARLRRREGTTAVLFLDLHNFKDVNDSLGHEAGDRLLIEVAERLRACLRPEDTVARLGGDEFSVLLERVLDESEATIVAIRITEALRAAFVFGNRETFVAANIGIALGTSGKECPADLLRQADIAMYEAKNKGKVRYEVFDSRMRTHVLESLRGGVDLRRAIEREEFEVHYQPKVSLESGRIFGVEALVRWRHPERGLVSPGEFIPLTEETGLIVPIGRWVLKEACRQAKAWQEQQCPSEPPLVISVNLSARQFQHPGLAQDIAEVLRETGLDPHSLNLEITESVVMEDAGNALTKLDNIKASGVQFALDDFGTGYSSLSYLASFPVDCLKIDRSFVGKMSEDERSNSIVRGIINLANALGLEVIAEGVENAEQSKLLRAMGCNLVQGYYFAKPLTVDAATALLRQGVVPQATKTR